MLHRNTYNFSLAGSGLPLHYPTRAAPGRPSPKAKHPSVKFQPDQLAGTNIITRHDADALWVGGTRFGHSLLVPWQGTVLHWAPTQPDDLTPADFEALLALKPELVIFGSGPRHRFVSPALMRALIEHRIGVETMDTPAACRTYNVLVAEGRSAVAALLLKQGTGAAPTLA